MNERLGYLRKEWKEGALMEHYSREYISTLLGSFMYLGSQMSTGMVMTHLEMC